MKRFIETSHLSPPLKLALKAPRALTAPLRVLPDFIIIGAQRCGTTSLYRYLTKHPRVVPAFRKEVHFFCKNFKKGLNWYREHFPTHLYKYSVGKLIGKSLLTGEASTDYILHPKAAERAFNALPRVKLIVVLRNPVDRAYSHYYLEIRRGRESLSFEEAIKLEPERLKGEKSKVRVDDDDNTYNYQHYSYLTRGIYIDQLKPWMTLFPRDQVFILRSEDFFMDPPTALSQAQEYLGLERQDLEEYEKYNYAGYLRLDATKHNDPAYPRMSGGLRRDLIDYFKPHNESLYKFLERDFGWEE